MQRSKIESRCNMKNSRGLRSKLVILDDYCDLEEELSMNYHNITHDDMLNGSGLRVVLWCSGCERHCKNCQNPQTWDYESGISFDEKAKKELFDELKKDYISGITFSGGDPLASNNLFNIYNLMKEIKSEFPQKTIWLYTGYTWEQIMYPVVTNDFNIEKRATDQMREQIVSYCDVVVDGEYVDELRDITLHWCGSSNQRVIDVQKSLSSGKVVLYEE